MSQSGSNGRYLITRLVIRIREVLFNLFQKFIHPTPHDTALYTLSAQRTSVQCGSYALVSTLALLTPDESSATRGEHHWWPHWHLSAYVALKQIDDLSMKPGWQIRMSPFCSCWARDLRPSSSCRQAHHAMMYRKATSVLLIKKW